MEIHSTSSSTPLPTDRVYVMRTVIKSFKGRRDVMVHLFRSNVPDEEMKEYPWMQILGEPLDNTHVDPVGSRKVLLEAFTAEERDQIIEYLKTRYKDRLKSIECHPMDFPIPIGLSPLSSFPEGRTIGFVRFDHVPNYKLPFAFEGLYDLSQHEPIEEDVE